MPNPRLRPADRPRLLASVLAVGVYLAAFDPAYAAAGNVVVSLSVIPVSVLALLWGSRIGVLAAIGAIVGNIVLLVVVAGWEIAALIDATLVLRSVAILTVGLVIGLVRDLRVALVVQNARLGQAVEDGRRTAADLRAERNFIDSVVDTEAALVIVLDREGRIERFNTAYERISGWSAEEVLGRPFWEILIPPETVVETMAVFRRVVAGGPTTTTENVLVTRTGRHRLIDWSTASILDGEGRVEHLVATGIDITERRRAEEAIAAVDHVGRLLATAGPTREALDSVLSQLGDRFGYRYVSIYLVDGDELVLGAQRGYATPIERFAATRGVMGRVWQRHETAWVSDTAADPDFVAADPEVSCEISVPLLADGRMLGILNVEGVRSARPLDAGDVRLIESVADRLASAIVLGQGRLELAARAEALRVSEEQTRLIIETASYAFISMDVDGLIVDWNQEASTTFGWERADVLGRALSEIVIPEESRAAHEAGLARFLATGLGPMLGHRIEVEALHRDGRRFPIQLTIWAVKTGGTIRFNALADDITVRKGLEDELRHNAFHDALTGLANRSLFGDRVEHALASGQRGGSRVAVLFLDLDEFKTINDSLGHSAGDALLVAVASRLRGALRAADTVARLGGDEFAILIDGPTTEGSAVAAGERILAALAEPLTISGRQVVIGASIGLALSSPAVTSATDLLRNADVAMYRAKAAGKGRLIAFEPAMHQRALARLDTEAALRAAIDRREFFLEYQPVVALDTGLIVGFEALIRWNHPVRGVVGPAEFIPIAEETGLILPIGRWVLETACREAAGWAAVAARHGEPAPRPLDVSVNLSARQLADTDLVREVAGIIQRTGLAAERLTLELTESAMLADADDAIGVLGRLRDLGVRIAVDDFGTGYSSLRYVQRFPIDILKIDRSFIAGISAGGPEAAVARTLVQLGQALDIEIVAEGVEEEDQVGQLQDLGCGYGQGFLLGRPAPAAAVARMLAETDGPPRVALPARPERIRGHLTTVA